MSKLSDMSDMVLSLAKATHPQKGMNLDEWLTRLYRFYRMDIPSNLTIHALTFDVQCDLWSKLIATQGNRMMKIVERRSEFVAEEVLEEQKGLF